ncbi:hypothetical protein EYF80_003682 [Liparis tanakae]|uniref:Uncharacterized protein n=1 Tax=Liparis tanakae TaxID=230148 RepID=A0A4Z2J7E6_9TELE|nr:hypothetical protein EYF80_003682 [Liparis tanakae]
MNATGNDPDLHRMDQSILRTKTLMRLPIAVRNKVKEVVGLENMKKSVYTDHIAHQVELYRKKGDDLKEQDRETLRKLNHLQLVSDKVERKQALAMKNQDPPNQPVLQPDANQAEIQSFYTQQVFDQEQYWNESELEGPEVIRQGEVQRAELGPARDGALLCVLTNRSLHQEEWHATQNGKETSPEQL